MNLQSDNIIPEQRRAVILKHVQRQGSISVPEVARLLSASVSTVRRDLDELWFDCTDPRGAMLAISQQTTFELDYHFASQVFASKSLQRARWPNGRT
ncbi:MAG TPA: DeoR family transcriptional regulator [Desulfobacterales bacterium]|nr:DeoR family transcriptional regulator [Desulfobacterales bacterium]